MDLERAEAGLRGLLHWVRRSQEHRSGLGACVLPVGYFASVVDLGGGQGLAITTDGVGTKLLVAQLVDRYDTIGIDCVAMNVNDLLCVGAEPLALVDYLAVEDPHPRLLDEIGRGLYEGSRRARVSIVGGELAQVPSIVHGQRPGFGFDLAATCVGHVPLDRLIDGRRVQPGDVLIGLPSSGIHSNGLTLARSVLLEQAALPLSEHRSDLGSTLAAALLEPTEIYVEAVLELLRSGTDVRAMAHITGGGFLNLSRLAAPIGYHLDHLPDPPPIFQLIQTIGKVPDSEMYRVFNMGIGFCVTIPPGQLDDALSLLERHYPSAEPLGRAVADPERAVDLKQLKLVGRDGRFQPA